MKIATKATFLASVVFALLATSVLPAFALNPFLNGDPTPETSPASFATSSIPASGDEFVGPFPSWSNVKDWFLTRHIRWSLKTSWSG